MAATHKKLIEVALPLPEISEASSYDKRPTGPHPKGIHIWWARLPLPTARAILFASVVDDPGEHPEKWSTEEAQNKERERLFDIIRRMMKKKLHQHPEVYDEARAEMLKHCDGKLPAVFDPFAGGGSITLEANRLGFDAHAGDLNPIAVLLNKCNLEIVPRWLNQPPVNPADRKQIGGGEALQGIDGLANDIRYYGEKIRDHAIKSIGQLYPKARLSKQFGGGAANVIAWIWARTVASPSPAFLGKHVPLISTYWLSSKPGKLAWLSPVIDKENSNYRFEIKKGTPEDPTVISAGTKVGRGGFRCILSDDPIPFAYVRNEGRSGRIGSRLIATVIELSRGRTYISADAEQISAAECAIPKDFPDTDLPGQALGFRIQNYGIIKHWQMFSSRQLSAMVTLSDLIKDTTQSVKNDAIAAGLSKEDSNSYAQSISIFLGLCLDRCAGSNNTFCRWVSISEASAALFARQAISMVWDFVEPNILGKKASCWHKAVDLCAEAVQTIAPRGNMTSSARQIDAATGANGIQNFLVSTDPPYYDNIGYATLSDFFYVWLRRTVGNVYPDLFSTVLAPKIQELTAAPEKFDGDRTRARDHFETGFQNAFQGLRSKMDHRFPLTVYYAFKQDVEKSGEESEKKNSVDLTTGWETLLEALVSSSFQITGTWPIRASQAWRFNTIKRNALSSYIVLACRPRPNDAPQIASNQFRNELKSTLPSALRHLQQGNIAPVDFAQAAIGPGMAIYSRYSRILDSAGKAMTVRTALGLINQALSEVLSEQEDNFDADTRWAISWFEQHGFGEGDYGDAELLSKAKVTSVERLHQAGIVKQGAGKVRLLTPAELPADWDPASSKPLTVWEITHHLLRLYNVEKAGDEATVALLRKIGSQGEVARELAYRLHNLSERKKRSQEAQDYNALVLGWPEIARLAREKPETAQTMSQGTLI